MKVAARWQTARYRKAAQPYRGERRVDWTARLSRRRSTDAPGIAIERAIRTSEGTTIWHSRVITRSRRKRRSGRSTSMARNGAKLTSLKT